MNGPRVRCFVLCLVSLVGGSLLGCGEDEPAPSQLGASAGAGGGSQGEGGRDGAVVGPEIALSYGELTGKVDLGKLTTQTYKDTAVIPLSVIWSAGNVGKPASELVFDFEGDDGFKPSSKEKCATPVKGADLDKGYLLPATRSLVWDDSLGFAGCFGVKGLKTIIALDP